MSALADLQRTFQSDVLALDGGLAPLIAGRDRADIYRDAYRARLVEALALAYPALRAATGEAFDTLAADYVAAHPSRFRSIRDYGAELASHIAATAQPPDAIDVAMHADLARFEWALGLVFDAADVEPVAIQALARVPAEDWAALQLDFVPALGTLTLRTNAVDWYRAGVEDAASPERALRTDPARWAVWRAELRSWYRVLPPDEAWALAAARDGASFGELCEGLANHVAEEQVAMRGAQLLANWLSAGWVARLA